MPERKKILLVEDDAAIRDLCCEILLDAGYEVHTAVHGKEAFQMLKSEPFDLVLTDINMPELDGIGLYLNAIKDFGYLKNRFLFMTGGPADDLETRSVLANLKNKCLKKPFRIKELLSSIEDLTAAPRQRPGQKAS